MLISGTFRKIFKDFLQERVMEAQEFKVFCEMARWNSLEHLKICEVKKKTSSLRALYRGRK